MRQSERAWRLAEASARVELFRHDLPMMLLRLSDLQEAGDAVPVSGGSISDPTSGAAASAVDFTQDMDQAIRQLHAQAERLERMRDGLVGKHAPPPTTDERGRPIRDGQGNPIEYCELHQLAGQDVEARRRIPHPSGSGTKMKVCRWCGDHYDATGSAPLTSQVLENIEGKRVLKKGAVQ